MHIASPVNNFSVSRTVPGVGLYFSSMHWMRYSVFQGKPNAGQSLLIGAAARTFAGSVMIPFTVVKTRYFKTSVLKFKIILFFLGLSLEHFNTVQFLPHWSRSSAWKGCEV